MNRQSVRSGSLWRSEASAFGSLLQHRDNLVGFRLGLFAVGPDLPLQLRALADELCVDVLYHRHAATTAVHVVTFRRVAVNAIHHRHPPVGQPQRKRGAHQHVVDFSPLRSGIDSRAVRRIGIEHAGAANVRVRSRVSGNHGDVAVVAVLPIKNARLNLLRER